MTWEEQEKQRLTPIKAFDVDKEKQANMHEAIKNSRKHTWTTDELKQQGIFFDLNGNPQQINEEDIQKFIKFRKEMLIMEIYRWLKFHVEVELPSNEILSLFEHDFIYKK